MIRSSRVLTGFFLASFLGGCTAILGIDESFEQEGADGGAPGDGGTRPGSDATTGGDGGGSGTDATTGQPDAHAGDGGGDDGGGGGGKDGGPAPAWALDTSFGSGGQTLLAAAVAGGPVTLVIEKSGRLVVVGASATGGNTAYWIVDPSGGTQPAATRTGLDHPTDAILGDNGVIYVATTTSYEDNGTSSSVEVTGLDAATGLQHSYTTGNTYVQRIVSVSGSGPVAVFYTTLAHAAVTVTELNLDSGATPAAYELNGLTDVYGALPVSGGNVVAGEDQNAIGVLESYGVINLGSGKLNNDDFAGSGDQYTDIVGTSTGYVALGVGNTDDDTTGVPVFHATWLGPVTGFAVSNDGLDDEQYATASGKALLTEPQSHTRLVADSPSTFVAAGVVSGDSAPTLVRFGTDGKQDLTFGATSPPAVAPGQAALGNLVLSGTDLYVTYSVSDGSTGAAAWVVARYVHSGT